MPQDAVEVVAQLAIKIKNTLNRPPLYVGIDPGADGAIAFLFGNTPVVIDIPTLKVSRSKGHKTVFNHPQIVTIFHEIRKSGVESSRVHVCLEQPPPSMGPGKGSAYAQFRLGCAYAMWPLFLFAKGYSVEEVSPMKWKKAMGLAGKDKESSRYKALGMYPKADLRLKRHHNRSEALLLAVYLKRLYSGREFNVRSA